ncbi:TPR-like protein [Hesseltinella vesiculosa]|uniref:TPR-like protein n=1 Tax=Hesseltinella vesiculosa TaxID=101127 RepID=A0A1X2G4X9_9FUNG|nr:TPR-like protein [Hesseltinella vesiculosa]
MNKQESDPPPYFNSAAAYSQQGDHQKAVDDAKKAAEIDPSYSKAYSRMGHAYFCLEKYDEAVTAYEKGLELDPNNQTIKSSLATAKAKADRQSLSTTDRGDAGAGGAGGFPGLGGGMPDLGSLLNNPQLMNMAQQMMQSGALDQFMNNPEMARMAQQMMGGGGGGAGGPNLSEMMNNPELMNMARNFMGGSGRNNNGANGDQ